MSQLPESPAAGWPDQGYDPSAYPQQGEALSANGAAQQQYAQGQAEAQWQQDTQPDWGASQQDFPQQGYPQQDYGQQYQQPGFQAQQQWPGQAEPTMVVPPQAAADGGEAGLPTEFDHLFRDSTPDSRRAIDRQKPAVGGAAPGYLNGVQSGAQPEAASSQAPQGAVAEQTPAGAQGAQYQQPYQGFPQQAEQPFQQEQFQQGQYQGAAFQSGQYAPAEYPQPGYGGEYGGADNGGADGGSGNWGGRGRNKRPLIIGGAVVLVAVIGVAIAMSGGGGSGGTPTAGVSASASTSALTKQQQADKIYALIQQSGDLRAAANTAVVEVTGCKNLTDAQNTLTDTAAKRQTQADSVAKLDVSKITDGAALVAQLQAAWTASAQYDSAFAQVAGDMQTVTCKASVVKKDANYKTASQAASAADTAKAAAAQLWNTNVASLETTVTEAKL